MSLIAEPPRSVLVSPPRLPDPGGLAFRELEALGERAAIRFQRFAGGEVEEVDVPHCSYDGIGGLVELLRGRGLDVGPLPALARAKRPGVLRTIWAALRHDPGGERRPLVRWSRFDASARPGAGPRQPASRLLDEDETARLEGRARAAGASPNSLLLAALDAVVAERLVQEPAPGLWLMPVNMRGAVASTRDTANHSSFLPVTVAPGAPAEAVHAEVRRLLSAQVHWAAWAQAVVLPRWVSPARYSAFVKTYHARPGHPWRGAFSNLGAWDQDAGADGWTVSPPVAKTIPIAAGALTCRGRLGLTLDAHPVLQADRDDVAGWLDAWIERALGE